MCYWMVGAQARLVVVCCAAGVLAWAGQAGAIDWDGDVANDGELDGQYTNDANWVGDKMPDSKETAVFSVTGKAYTVVLDEPQITALSTSINTGEVTFLGGNGNGNTGWQPGELFVGGVDTLALFNGLDFDMSATEGAFQISNGATAGFEDVSGQMLNFTVGDTPGPSVRAEFNGADFTLIPSSGSVSGAFNVIGQAGDGGSIAILGGNSSVDANFSGIGITNGSRGTLEIQQSSEVTADTMLIGAEHGRGDVSVSGSGSKLTVGGSGGSKNLFVGSSSEAGSGSGSLTLDTNGTAEITASLFANFNSLVDNRQGTLTVADQAQFSGQFRQAGNSTSITRFDGDAVFNKTSSYAQTSGVVRFVGAADFSESGATFSHTGGEISFEGGAAFGQTTIGLGDPDADETAQWNVSSDLAFARALRVGDTADTRGGVTVSSGGVLRNTLGGGAADLVVGLDGRGDLAITATGVVDIFDDLIVASNAGSEGVVTLTDQAQVFVNRNGSGSNLFVGLNGLGQLDMDGNSRLTVGNDVVVGAGDPGLEVTSQLRVGSSSLNIPSDAQLSVGGDLIIGPGFPGTPSGQLLFRDGSVAIQNGGLVTVADTVHLQEGGGLSVGPNGRLITQNFISDMGSSPSTILGELTIDGGVAEMPVTQVGVDSSRDYDSALRAVNGGIIRAVESETVISGRFRIPGVQTGVSGTIEAVGLGSRYEQASGPNSVLLLRGSNSTFRVTDGASAALSRILMFGPGSTASTNLVDVVGGSGGVASRLDVGDESNPGSIYFSQQVITNEAFFTTAGGGTIRVREGGILDLWGGTMRMDPNLDNDDPGRVTQFIVTGSGTAGASTARLGRLQVTDSSAMARIEQGGRVFTSVSTYLLDSSLVVDGGELYTPLLWTQGTTSQFELLGDGVLETAQVAGGLDNQGGILRPGAGTGLDTIADQISDLTFSFGNYTQGAAATLEIQLAGTTAGTEHDRLFANEVTLEAGTTLAIELLNGFMPTLGDSFEIIVADTITGTFGQTTGLDLADGLALQVAYALDRITLNVVSAILAGDYNGNGAVDAADYTVWADNFGSMVNLAADGNGNGTIDAADYTIWADNFGTTAGINSTLTIPEPATLSLVMVGLAWGLKRRRA